MFNKELKKRVAGLELRQEELEKELAEQDIIIGRTELFTHWGIGRGENNSKRLVSHLRWNDTRIKTILNYFNMEMKEIKKGYKLVKKTKTKGK